MIELKVNDLLKIEDKEDKGTWFSLVAGVNDWGDKNFCRYILKSAPGFNEDFMDNDHSSEIIVVWRYDETTDGFVKIYDKEETCKTVKPSKVESNELDALEDIVYYLKETNGANVIFFKHIDIIRTALKNYAELTNKPVLYCGRTNEKTRAIIDAICKNYKEVKVTCLEDVKKLKAFEIIKKYPRCSLQRYIAFNELVKDGYELTKEHLFYQDMPCSVEEYKIVIEALKE